MHRRGNNEQLERSCCPFMSRWCGPLGFNCNVGEAKIWGQEVHVLLYSLHVVIGNKIITLYNAVCALILKQFEHRLYRWLRRFIRTRAMNPVAACFNGAFSLICCNRLAYKIHTTQRLRFNFVVFTLGSSSCSSVGIILLQCHSQITYTCDNAWRTSTGWRCVIWLT